MKPFKPFNIEEEFKKYCDGVYKTRSMSVDQITELRRAFCAALLLIIDHLTFKVSEQPEDVGCEELKRITRSLGNYFEKGGVGEVAYEIAVQPEPAVKAPFTPEQVEALNAFQNDGRFHPFTCGKCPGQSLVAVIDGWICPTCDYTQDWSHAFMTKPIRHQVKRKCRTQFPNHG